MKKSLLIGALLVGGLALTGVGIVQAMGFGWQADLDPAEVVERQEAKFQGQAEMFGISEDQVKDYWAQGLHPKEIAEELGISEEEMQTKIQQRRQQMMEGKMQILVENGVITQEQADQKVEKMADWEPGEGCQGKAGRGMGRKLGF